MKVLSILNGCWRRQNSLVQVISSFWEQRLLRRSWRVASLLRSSILSLRIILLQHCIIWNECFQKLKQWINSWKISIRNALLPLAGCEHTFQCGPWHQYISMFKIIQVKNCYYCLITFCLHAAEVVPSETSSNWFIVHFVFSVDVDEIKRLGKRFRKLDLDNSGSLSIDEFMSLPELQQNPLVQRVIDIFDTDGNGEVDFKGEPFVCLVIQIMIIMFDCHYQYAE